MSLTAPSRSSKGPPTTELINYRYIRPNPWNPNRMTSQMYAKEIESIATYGFIDPLLVREIGPNDYQIIDGEHRFDGGRSLGMEEFPCVNLGVVPDPDAKKLTIVMNELHGQADAGKLGDLLGEILQDTSLEELLVALPYTEDVLAGYLGTALPPLPELETPAPAPGASPEPWVERLYKLPKTAALVVDEALEKAKDGEAVENWQALERVAADYLAS